MVTSFPYCVFPRYLIPDRPAPCPSADFRAFPVRCFVQFLSGYFIKLISPCPDWLASADFMRKKRFNIIVTFLSAFRCCPMLFLMKNIAELGIYSNNQLWGEGRGHLDSPPLFLFLFAGLIRTGFLVLWVALGITGIGRIYPVGRDWRVIGTGWVACKKSLNTLNTGTMRIKKIIKHTPPPCSRFALPYPADIPASSVSSGTPLFWLLFFYELIRLVYNYKIIKKITPPVRAGISSGLALGFILC